MNTFALIRHLLWNDVRRLRWQFVAYVGCTLLATVAALTLAFHSSGGLEIMPVLVFMAGFFLIASAVQVDSPYRTDAFWVSRPIEPVAVLGAKLVLAGLVLALPVAGLTWTLVHIGLPTSDLGSTLGPVALDYVTWLLFGMAIAAVTPDFRGFATVMVGLMALSVVVSFVLLRQNGSSFEANETAKLLTSLLIRVGPLALLVFVYLRRDAVRRARTIGAVLLAASLVIAPYATPRGNPVGPAKEALRATEAPQISLVFDGAAPGDRPQMLRLHVNGKPWRNAARLVVTVNSLLVHAKDGTTFAAQRVGPLVVRLRDSLPNGAVLSDLTSFSSSVLYLGPGEMRRLTSGIESIELVGTVEPYAVRIAAILPFTSGAQVRQGGTMFQVDSVERDPAVSSAVATTVSIRVAGQSTGTEAQQSFVLPRFVLVDDHAHRAITNFGQSSRMSSGGMILPELSVLSRWTKLEVRWPVADTGSAMAPARLMWLEWKSLGQAPVRLRATRE